MFGFQSRDLQTNLCKLRQILDQLVKYLYSYR